jgi:hypothetical protein
MKNIFFFLLATFTSVLVMAQEEVSGKLDVNINTDEGSSFLTSPWVWVVGAAVLILLLVALSGGSSRRVSNTTVERTTTGSGGQVTTTRTTTSDDDLV